MCLFYVSESAQLAFLVPPVFFNFHEKFEVYTFLEKGFYVFARFYAHFLDFVPTMTYYDSLLAVSFHIYYGHYVY